MSNLIDGNYSKEGVFYSLAVVNKSLNDLKRIFGAMCKNYENAQETRQFKCKQMFTVNGF